MREEQFSVYSLSISRRKQQPEVKLCKRVWKRATLATPFVPQCWNALKYLTVHSQRAQHPKLGGCIFYYSACLSILCFPPPKLRDCKPHLHTCRIGKGASLKDDKIFFRPRSVHRFSLLFQHKSLYGGEIYFSD